MWIWAILDADGNAASYPSRHLRRSKGFSEPLMIRTSCRAGICQSALSVLRCTEARYLNRYLGEHVRAPISGGLTVRILPGLLSLDRKSTRLNSSHQIIS